jgi:transposase
MKRKQPKPIDAKEKDLRGLRDRAAKGALDEKDLALLDAVLDTLIWLMAVLERGRTSLARLRRLVFGPKTEKTRDLLGGEGVGPDGDDEGTGGGGKDEAGGAEGEKLNDKSCGVRKKRKGHGRNAAAAYAGAHVISTSHEEHSAGDRCPECKKGKVYELPQPQRMVRVTGQAPIMATVYEQQRLRCNLCGKVFTAAAPKGVGTRKYDEASASVIALLKYGSGMPFNRLARLEGNLGIPLPASTQWDIVRAAAAVVGSAYEELIREAAQGEVLYNDDTTVKILEHMGKRALAQPEDEDSSSKRTGLFTSGIVSTSEGRRIALFFSGRKHAGENLAKVLAERVMELEAPIQMCDALSRNTPQDLETKLSNCLAHGRRQFVDLVRSFPEECTYVLESVGKVYEVDAGARKDGLDPEARLLLHQEESGPVMAELHEWLQAQTEQKLVEPNSPLGEALAYMVKHWKKLSLFLREPGAPIDNNVCERALKKAILHRKNALFFRSDNGARVGDIFTSLIHTAELNRANAFELLTELQKHVEVVREHPEQWMPWNYREALAAQTGASTQGS